MEDAAVGKELRAICVYCGSSAQVSAIYKQAATRLGALIAARDLCLVYGGGRVGLMGLVSDAVLDAGGEAVGIIPGHIADKEIAHTSLTRLHIVETMHERKQMMVDLADAFVILPGGLGTMDEFFEIFTWWQLGLHDKPIILVNVNGYWSKLLDLLDHVIEEKFARPSDRQYLYVVDSVEDVPAALENAPRQTMNVKTKWL